ncbi:hypothetical protein WUBG_07711 [Wuchereria bancrofti]|nr:hypothetical protein WUBG_07711 [Wuchereria bancrofti]
MTTMTKYRNFSVEMFRNKTNQLLCCISEEVLSQACLGFISFTTSRKLNKVVGIILQLDPEDLECKITGRYLLSITSQVKNLILNNASKSNINSQWVHQQLKNGL